MAKSKQKSIKSRKDLVGGILIVNGSPMLRILPPAGPPEHQHSLNLLHYHSSTEIHRYCADHQNFVSDGSGGLKTKGFVPRYVHTSTRDKYDTDVFEKQKSRLEAVGLTPISQ